MGRGESMPIDDRSSIRESSAELWTAGPGSQISLHGHHQDDSVQVYGSASRGRASRSPSGLSEMISPWPPTFEPLKRLSRGHQQTLAGYCAWAWQRADQTRQHRVTLADGDRIVLHDDCPSGWRPGHRVALLVPGLGGSHATPYLVRSAAKLNRRGTRTFRMDQRGFGSAANLARWPHHAGRSGDVAAALRVDRPDSPTAPRRAWSGSPWGGTSSSSWRANRPTSCPRTWRA